MPAARTRATPGPARPAAWVRRIGAAALIAVALLLGGNTAAEAHVVPWTTIQLDVGDGSIQASVDLPADDLAAATGLDLGGETQADIDAHAAEITSYLREHFTPRTDDGQAWTVAVGPLSVAPAGSTSTTGLYQQLTTTFTLTPPSGADERSFQLGYDAVIERVITHVVVVSVHSDWAAGTVEGAYELGTIRLDTVSGTVSAFHVDLDQGSDLRGLWSMFLLGVQHIQEGTDHQLFLLALLIPAPLLVTRRRWGPPATTRQAVRRIGGITLAFTIGHSVTLALGALGLPVPQQPVEALIAISIVVAAAHAARPIFPGREAWVAGAFGLVHGLAFSEALGDLHLSGTRLVLSLLGFNLGIEAMQLFVVALTLPPLIVLARGGHYRTVRLVAATTAGIAAVGWFSARIGYANPVADVADRLGVVAVPLVAALWIAAAALVAARRVRPPTVLPDETHPVEAVSAS